MEVVNSAKLDVGSDHNFIQSKIIWERKEVRRRERYILREGGKLDGEKYQELVEEVFIGWEEKVREFKQELGGGIVEEVWNRWKEKEMGRKMVTEEW